MMPNFDLFATKAAHALNQHDMSVSADQLRFSSVAMQHAELGDMGKCAAEFATKLETILSPILAPSHAFESAPYVRKVDLPDGRTLYVAIINEQSREWYGSEHFVGACDFLIPAKQGLFQDCKTYLDLGGHQLIWTSYYAGTHPDSQVMTFEPSILNVLIGIFNCLVNDVIERVEVVPFAVKVKGLASNSEANKMLVDFLTVPLRTTLLMDHIKGVFDFTKTDIEGYEYEMLNDPTYIHLLKSARFSHFELHLGHLVKRGISREDCTNALKKVGVMGTELYSGQEMYAFLEQCDRNGFYAFMI